MTKIYEVREWIPRWVREYCLVEADTPEEAIEKYHDGDVLDYVPDRDDFGDRVDGRDSYGLEASEEKIATPTRD